MGEVYKARDTRLDRIVAIKIISNDVSELRDRFEREARTISLLQHPHICVLHDVGQHDGLQFLVMEYLEGETLAERLRQGTLPLTEAFRYAIQIVSALQAAHDRGVVHRDLKPANIMLTSSGAKLLDFGLARVLPPKQTSDDSLLATHEHGLTQQGTILGTFQYMAPEQLEGQDVDARTDIFSFGALMYEMVTGRKAFEGKSQASLIAKILEGQPPPLRVANPAVPPALEHLVEVCLQKSPNERWQTARDVLTQLTWIANEGQRPATTGARRYRTWATILGVAALLGVVLLAASLFRGAPEVASNLPAGRFDVNLPEELGPVVPVISPDSRRVAFAPTKADRRRLWVRTLNSSAVLPLPGTDGALMPFWSHDGESLGFFVDGKLKRITATGGALVTLADAPEPGGGTWTSSGDILFASRGIIHRVGETGGAVESLTVLDKRRGDAAHSFPSSLPGSGHFVYLVDGNAPGVYATEPGSTSASLILNRAPSFARVVRPGYLIFVEQQNLMVQPFDLRSLTLNGRPRVLASGVPNWAFSASESAVIFASIPNSARRLVWVDRQGARINNVGEPGGYRQVVLAPSGRRAVLERQEDGGANVDLWLLDTATGVLSRLTLDPAQDADAAWSPDEAKIVFSSSRLGKSSIFAKDLATGDEKPILQAKEGIVVDDWSADGQFVVYRDSGRAVFALRMAGGDTRMLVDTPFVEDQSHVSPDGAWIAFNSNESGRWEVYVARFPDFTRKRQVSTGGGVQPLWRRDGRELFYMTPTGRMMAVTIVKSETLEMAAARPLFESGVTPSATQHEYGVSPDGQRFLIMEPAERRAETVTFLTNWRSEITH